MRVVLQAKVSARKKTLTFLARGDTLPGYRMVHVVLSVPVRMPEDSFRSLASAAGLSSPVETRLSFAPISGRENPVVQTLVRSVVERLSEALRDCDAVVIDGEGTIRGVLGFMDASGARDEVEPAEMNAETLEDFARFVGKLEETGDETWSGVTAFWASWMRFIPVYARFESETSAAGMLAVMERAAADDIWVTNAMIDRTVQQLMIELGVGGMPKSEILSAVWSLSDNSSPIRKYAPVSTTELQRLRRFAERIEESPEPERVSGRA